MIQLEKKQQLALLMVIGIILFGAGFKYAQVRSGTDLPDKPVLEKREDLNSPKSKEVIVHVLGAVNNPGVYHFPEGSRVIDAVDKAKASNEADLNAINLAALLIDGTPVMIPFKQPEGAENGINSAPTAFLSNTAGAVGNYSAAISSGSGAGKVNINTAGVAELDSLPGIGPALAERIVQYRQANGPFRTIEDLKNVSGIGDKKFEDLKDLIII
ncbi:ComEA family DNA-binding protein [Desulfolucanica intricata]|uniref:ComEA family DNA-binding protein n=1 Tax=Desulfolucanica intricata TaxID=1285191 RepID=UPI00082E0203|nr:ComEA family DNA-binding protein [Desulfolucanica intricata]